ncbi:MAG: hypothetical protein A2494_00455 [Candidatus Lloydbacteria bacterium RIFOXYC12_FULL_46_25]|uniref:DJ-1/PfpI domain-containing protein n=1 Tax=Candidatus Lloydbacteria bacterium RIFOXYC12_FULL_46_25 TaxID=1798670 RepID=A0A1G2DXA0_9BACT|nr:MAG: hypothetical protein A2494_00455 [Candidatus Lloydbacteria bacterium RIFOXYC12_FULL_46_25]
MAKILLIVAQEGFQTREYHDTRRVLERAGHTVITASNEAGVAISNVGEEIVADVALRDVSVSEYDGIFIIGGPGALKYLDNADTASVMKDASAHEKIYYGAICIAPRILAKAGLLSERRATGWDGDHELSRIFEKYSVAYESDPVVVDGRIITADGPASAEMFGIAIDESFKE